MIFVLLFFGATTFTPYSVDKYKFTPLRCGTPKQSWRLIFRASTHGFSAQAFHSHCDGVAPVLLLVQVHMLGTSSRYCYKRQS